MMRKPRSHGFTLVELLVVMVIVATLAGLTTAFLPKALKKGAQTKAIQQMRQMSASLELYAKDHANRIPPVITPAEDSEEKRETPWVYYMEQMNSNKDLDVYFRDKWWQENRSSIYRNPLQPKNKITAKSTGYAMNAALAYNLAASRGEKLDLADAKYVGVNLNAVQDGTKVPIIIPHWGWSYVGDKKEMSDKRFEPFLVSDRIPVLFLDSHVEVMTPKEYVSRGLNAVPNSGDSDEDN
jgi:prepilin-type N-terminal cleavage/methylation domain-containing protein